MATDSDPTTDERARRDAILTRAMGVFFAIGSLCFVVGPLNSYADAVGGNADGLTFFIGSILFTLGGACQCLLAVPERPDHPTGVASWRTAWIQSVGTLLFNLMTFAALTIVITDHGYDTIVWVPNAIGSLCFLISGAIFYLFSPRRGLLPRTDHEGWWEAAVNLLGCVLFGISAVTGYVTGHPSAPVSTGITNWTTTLGAVCFLAVALTACGLGATLKAPRLRRLRQVAREMAEAVKHEAQALEQEAQEVRDYVEKVSETMREEMKAAE
jgi:hypothetical protein